MTDIAARRLRAQHLIGAPFSSAIDAVRWLTAVQSQDYAGAKWALGLRAAGATDAELDRLVDEGAILRTHVMRPTWHFVLAEDIRWLLELTSPRLLAGLEGRYRQLELDPRTRTRAVDLFGRALAGGKHLTRVELGKVLAGAGISPDGQRLPHLLGLAEAQGVIISGQRRGKQFTYALLDERVPATRQLDRDDALTQLTIRYFQSHGPATVQDFGWWSGLTVTDTRRGIATARDHLNQHTIAGIEYWSGDNAAVTNGSTAAHLLPNFDEFTVAYRDRSALLHPGGRFDPSFFAYFRASSPQGGLLSNVVTINGTVRGSWRRTVTPSVVDVEVRLLWAHTRRQVAAIEQAAERFGRFLDRRVTTIVV